MRENTLEDIALIEVRPPNVLSKTLKYRMEGDFDA